MNTREFFKHVVRMRHNQRMYFSTRDNIYMVQSQILETELDMEIARSCVHDAEMEKYVRTEYPELTKQIEQFKHPQNSLFD